MRSAPAKAGAALRRDTMGWRPASKRRAPPDIAKDYDGEVPMAAANDKLFQAWSDFPS